MNNDIRNLTKWLNEDQEAPLDRQALARVLAMAEQPAPMIRGDIRDGLVDDEPAQQQEPVAWVPYLSDRADGVKGHYAIARWNPRGYREVWNLRSHQWSAYSDDVLSLEEADALLRLITIPTRKVTSPPASKPLTDEEIKSVIQSIDPAEEYLPRALQQFARAIEAKLKEKNT